MIEIALIALVFTIASGVYIAYYIGKTPFETRFDVEVRLNKQDAALALKNLDQLLTEKQISQQEFEEQKRDLLTRFHADKQKSEQILKQDKSLKVIMLSMLATIVVSLGLYYTIGDTEELKLWETLRMIADDEATLKTQLFENPELTNQQKADRLLLLLRTKTYDEPENVEAWRRLGSAMVSMGGLEQGRQAYQKGFELEPVNTQLYLEWVQHLFEQRRQETLKEAVFYLEKVLSIDANHESALIMLAFAQDQLGEKKKAIGIWRNILEQRQPTEKLRTLLESNIARAEAELDVQVGLVIKLQFSENWTSQVSDSDTVFVVAKAADAAAPVAVYKSSWRNLPKQIHLTDANAMTPAFKLSKFQHANIIVRVEKGEKITENSKLRFESNLLPLHTGKIQTLTITSE